MIKIKNLNKYFKERHVLKNINYNIIKKDRIAIIGPSGSGKSTFLRCLNLLEKPTSGQIYFNDAEITNNKTDIKKVRQKMNMVFQYFNLFENKTVLENIILAPTKLKKINVKKAIENAVVLLKRFNLEKQKDLYPKQLSGGQKQRIAIIRSIAMNPEVILFDEPTSSLDPEMIDEVLNVIYSLTKSKITMVFVTHELNFARKIATRVVFMCNGKFLEEGTPEKIFNNPETERLKSFLKKF